ncbi:MAG TPA: SpoIIE family protein phosphatase [Kiritimatiellia bacterium]|nr:SpoIIE family protein phosphatase [Kiritimatiellia bacterium]
MSAEHKPAPAPLDDSRLLRLLLENNPDHIYFKDREGRLLRVNHAVAHWYGLADPADAVGKTDRDFFSEEHARQAWEDEEEIIRTGNPMVGKVEKETWPDGRRTWVSTTKLPLKDEAGRIIGTFGISRDVTEQHLKDEQLARYAEDLRASNDRFRQELSLAGEVMNALSSSRLETFPDHLPDPLLRFHYRYSAAEVLSGDFYVVTPFNRDSAFIFLCDVMGHGVSAALVAAILRIWVGQMVRREMAPAALLALLNQRLYELFAKPDTLRFATAFCGVLDARNGVLRYASAGHPSPLVVPPGTTGAHPLCDSREKGPGLGLQNNALYEESKATLPPGARLLVFSDGLVEGWVDPAAAHVPELELCDWLNQRSAPDSAKLADQVFQHAVSHENNDLQDDICLVIVEREAEK